MKNLAPFLLLFLFTSASAGVLNSKEITDANNAVQALFKQIDKAYEEGRSRYDYVKRDSKE